MLRLSALPLCLAVLAFACSSGAGGAPAPTILYDDFSNTTLMTMNGYASKSGAALQLTPAATQVAGTAFHLVRQNVVQGFVTEFSFQGSGGEGIAMIFGNDMISVTGGVGYGLGYGGSYSGGTGLRHCLAIEFDRAQSYDTRDPYPSHVAVHYNGAAQASAALETAYAIAETTSDLRTTGVHTARVEYVPGLMCVYLDDMTHPALLCKIDLAQLSSFGTGSAWLGFSGATGSTPGVQQVLSWKFTPSGPCYPLVADTSGTGASDFVNLNIDTPDVFDRSDGPAPAARAYPEATAVTLAAPEISHRSMLFSHWESDGQRVGDSRSVTVGMTGPKHLTAVYRNSAPRALRVASTGKTNDTGENWEKPVKTLAASLAQARPGDEIWLKGDIYDEVVTLPAGVSIYGGFAGNETSRGQRDPVSHPSVIRGTYMGAVVTVQQSAGADTIIDGVTITGGSSTGGGGIRALWASPTIRNCKITGSGTWFGGGMYFAASNALVSGCLVTDCNSVLGAGICADARSAVAVENCVIRSNIGGGVYFRDSGGKIEGNLIRGNTGTGDGGGIDLYHSTATVASNVLQGNKATGSGAGIACVSFTGSIVNNTFASNEAGVAGGGINLRLSTPTIKNNIIYNCGIGISRADDYAVSPSNTCFFGNNDGNYTGGVTGSSDLLTDPLFVDAIGEDYHLSNLSPCINAGSSSGHYLPASDFEGDPRTLVGKADIGADELRPQQVCVGWARTQPTNAWVCASEVVVSAVANSSIFYAEAADRSSGIQVVQGAHGRSVGDIVRVTGPLKNSTSGFRFIAAQEVVASGKGSVVPMGWSCDQLGGGPWMYNSVTGAGQQGIAGSYGLNNIGLLGSCWGKVTAVNTSAKWFTLWDGGYRAGGTPIVDSGGANGIRVTASGLVLPVVGDIVRATGVSTCYKSGQTLFPALQVTRQQDIEKLN